MYSTVLFDLDGTLTDPKIGITKSVSYSLSKFGITIDNLDDLIKFIGPPLLFLLKNSTIFQKMKQNKQ
jgi:phosphoglycolate phosphatase